MAKKYEMSISTYDGKYGVVYDKFKASGERYDYFSSDKERNFILEEERKTFETPKEAYQHAKKVYEKNRSIIDKDIYLNFGNYDGFYNIKKTDWEDISQKMRN